MEIYPRENPRQIATVDPLTFAKFNSVVSLGDILDSGAIHDFGLKKDDWVGVANGRQQQALGIVRIAGNDHFETWNVGEKALHRLGVVQASMTHGAVRSANRQSPHIKLVSAAISHFCRLVHNLVKSLFGRIV